MRECSSFALGAQLGGALCDPAGAPLLVLALESVSAIRRLEQAFGIPVGFSGCEEALALPDAFCVLGTACLPGRWAAYIRQDLWTASHSPDQCPSRSQPQSCSPAATRSLPDSLGPSARVLF